MGKEFEVVEVTYDVQAGKPVEKRGLIIGRSNSETEELYAIYILDLDEVIYLTPRQFRRTGQLESGTALSLNNVGDALRDVNLSGRGYEQ